MAGDYEKMKLLGSGSYGKAWLVNCRSNKRQAVLKEIKLDSLSDKEIRQALVEVKVLAKCRHVNIVSYCEAFESSCCLNIVMEFADNGDLQKKIVKQKGIHFDSETILDWFIQICFALKYLHSENILHRDLKPQNLFLTSDGVVKVGDFGIARILEDAGDHALTAVGTPYYLSPEICLQKPYNSKSDMWSMGCVLYELCSLRVPFQAPSLPMLVLSILEGDYDPIPSHYGAVLEDLVSVLLKTDPLQRPSAQQVLSVPALQQQVKVTYRRCLRHKQQSHRQRLLSKEPVSPVVIGQQEADKSPSCHRTFTVRSPLVRRLSVSTPKLKAAIKRQCSVQSAEPVATGKRRRQNTSPPVFDLQEAVLSRNPSCGRGVDLNHPQKTCIGDTSNTASPDPHKDGSSGDTDTDICPGQVEIDDCDDVFEDSGNVLGRDASDSRRVSPRNSCTCGTRQVLQKGLDTVGNKMENDICSLHQSTFDRKLENDDDAHSVIPQSTDGCKTKDKNRIFSSFPGSLCTAVGNKQFDDIMCMMAETSVTENHCDTDSMKTRHCEGKECCESPKRHRPLNSETYTVLGNIVTKRKSECQKCRNGQRSQQCLYQALYTATALSYRNKRSAQRCLSRFLIAHLGSDLSIRLCSLVNVALHAKEDYLTLEMHLDDECRSYLPVIFNLLNWSEEVVKRKLRSVS